MSETANDRRWTILELLNWTTGYFERAGIENPRLNAEMLLAKVTGLPRIMLYANFDRGVEAVQLEQFRDLVSRRRRRCPLQYLLGECEFYGRTFEVNPSVMAPRPETELVVDKCLEKIPGDGGGAWVADIGTGSGIIAVSLACERPALRVAAVDVSEQALEIARRNAARNGAAERIKFLLGRLCEPLSGVMRAEGAAPALIVSNPPYIPSAEIESLEPEVRDYEPRQALDGGPDGLSVIRELVPQAAEVLSPGGWLVLELGEGHAPRVKDMVAAGKTFDVAGVETVRDATDCERVLAVRKNRD